MPILIAHRGNTVGPDPKNENRPEYLNEALQAGFHVEVDIWYVDGEWWLGHDEPTHLFEPLCAGDAERVWFHAKNRQAFETLDQLGHMVFAHDKDPYVPVMNVGAGNRVRWCYPGVAAGKNGIQVHRLGDEVQWDAYGICSDYVADLKQDLDSH